MPSSTRVGQSLVALCLFAVPHWAQSFYGSIVGTINDSSGAAIPAALITVTNTNTSERRTTEASGDGSYRFVNLLPGTYTVFVEKPGFKRAGKEGISIEVA